MASLCKAKLVARVAALIINKLIGKKMLHQSLI
jgi:hypothetical protein